MNRLLLVVPLLLASCGDDAVRDVPPFDEFLRTTCPLESADLEAFGTRVPMPDQAFPQVNGSDLGGSVLLDVRGFDGSGIEGFRYHVSPGSVPDLRAQFSRMGWWSFYSDDDRASVDYQVLELPGCEAVVGFTGPASVQLAVQDNLWSLHGSLWYVVRDAEAVLSFWGSDALYLQHGPDDSLHPSQLIYDGFQWERDPL